MQKVGWPAVDGAQFTAPLSLICWFFRGQKQDHDGGGFSIRLSSSAHVCSRIAEFKIHRGMKHIFHDVSSAKTAKR